MSTLKSRSSGVSGHSVDRSYSFVQDQKRCKCDSSSLGSVSDANWCFNHHEVRKNFSYEQLDVLDYYIQGNVKGRGDEQLIEDYYAFDSKHDAAVCLDKPLKPLCSLEKGDQDGWMGDLGSVIDDGLQKMSMSKDMEAVWFSNANLMDLETSNDLGFERAKELSSDLESHFIGLKKVEPWWHAAEKDDLSSLLPQKPSETMNVEKDSADSVHFSGKVKEEMADREAEVAYLANSTRGDLSLSDKSLGKTGLTETIVQESDGTFSSSNGSNTVEAESFDTQESSSSDLSRTQLLEALCHSQTRAREAEKMAQAACDEKAHVIDLFFRQASYLFAYRQWLRMLQLETLCFRLRDKELNSLTPPAARNQGMVLRKNRRKASQKKLGKHRCHVTTCALAFAVGLGLAGAGLLVGWTIGWLFPPF